jgi:hypothetical protein
VFANRDGIGPLLQDVRDVRVGTEARLLSRDESSVDVTNISQANGIRLATEQTAVELQSQGETNAVDSAVHQNKCPVFSRRYCLSTANVVASCKEITENHSL